MLICSAALCFAKNTPPEETTCDFDKFHPAFFSHFEGYAIHKETPVYPAEAKKAGIEGTIVVVVLINRKGDVVKTCCEEGNELLKTAAMKAAAKWKFTPFKKIPLLPQCGYVQHGLVFNFKVHNP